MSELLPCPFCGGEAAFVRNEECGDDGEPHENFGGEWVECAKCRACTNIRFPLMESVKPLLAEQWNRRAGMDSARLDWLDRDDIELIFTTDSKTGEPLVIVARASDGHVLGAEQNLRAAIDAAMSNRRAPPSDLQSREGR